MCRSSKILLSIPSVIVLFYTITFFFPVEFQWVFTSMESYYIQTVTSKILTIIQVIFLVRKVWSYRNIEKQKKKEWTWILILFNSISCLVFLWYKIDEFETLDKSSKKQ